MIQSMTGYATVGRDSPVGVLTLELRSVNSRFLDLQFRIADDLRAVEPALREALTQRLGRGKVDCRLFFNRHAASTRVLALDHGLIRRLAELDGEVRQLAPQAQPLRVGEILHWPGVMGDDTLEPDELRRIAAEMLDDALGQLIDTRRREGDRLVQMLLERVSAMEAIVAEVQPLIPQAIAAHAAKLSERLQDAFAPLFAGSASGGNPAGVSREDIAERIRQEAAMFGVRVDVAEELSRLSTHLVETRRVLSKGGQAGKRLDFLMQELHREANTLGSKSPVSELSAASLELKLLIEQMREQVQNIE